MGTSGTAPRSGQRGRQPAGLRTPGGPQSWAPGPRRQRSGESVSQSRGLRGPPCCPVSVPHTSYRSGPACLSTAEQLREFGRRPVGLTSGPSSPSAPSSTREALLAPTGPSGRPHLAGPRPGAGARGRRPFSLPSESGIGALAQTQGTARGTAAPRCTSGAHASRASPPGRPRRLPNCFPITGRGD